MSYLSRVSNLFRRPSLEREFDEEIQCHLEERVGRSVAAGMAREDAEAEARRRFGSIDRAKAGMRAARLARPSSVVLPLLTATIVSVATSAMYLRQHERIYDVTGEIVAPVPVSMPHPEYTSAAMHEKIQGTLRLQCIVRRDGICSDVTVLRSLDKTFGLDDQAVHAVRDWRFRPGLKQGAPVATRLTFELHFALR